MLALMKSAKSGQWEEVSEVEPDLDMEGLGLRL